MDTVSDKKQKKSDRVIVRAFHDQPVRLVVVSVRETAVDVVGADQSRPVPFRVDRVYAYDPQLFAEMSDAYQSGDQTRLSALWDRADFYSHQQRKGGRRGKGHKR